MNTKGTTAKLNFLKGLHYNVQTLLDNSGIIAMHPDMGATITFTPEEMQVTTQSGFYSLKGWQEIDLEPFKVIAAGMGLIPMTEQEQQSTASLLANHLNNYTKSLS